MSRINDALKRAKAAQRKSDPAGTPPLPPAEARPADWDLGSVLPVAIILLVVAALFFIGLAIARRPGKTLVVAPESITNQPAEPAKATAPPAQPATSAVPATVANTAPRTNRLQGIAYDSVHAWAIISGKTVYVGDLVEGLRVTTITANSVTLAGPDRTNTITLSQ